MPKTLKWALIVFACLVVVLVVAIILAPMIINFEKYKPTIEAEASKAIGRKVTLGGQIAPSVFPWVGLALSDVTIENPSGFTEKHFVSLGLFEVRIKLLPLLSGAYEIKRFVVKSPHIVIEKTASGKSNLEGLGGTPKPAAGPTQQPPATPPPPGEAQLPVKVLKADEFAITDGRLLILDKKAATRQEISNVGLVLKDLSLDQPVGIDFNAMVNGRPIGLQGTVGPVGSQIGRQPIQMDVVAALLNTVRVQIEGQIVDVLENPRIDAAIEIPAFSLRKALSEAKAPLPFTPTDEKVLRNVALSVKVAGQPERIAISDGRLTLDDTQVTFQGQGQDWGKPDLRITAELDRIDLDRYLPPPAKKASGEDQKPVAPGVPPKETDYAPLRKLVLDLQLKAGQVIAKKMRMDNITFKATARDGIMRIDPLGMDLYSGRLDADSTINVQGRKPRSNVNATLNRVQSAPMIKDLLDKKLVEGLMNAALDLQFNGDTADAILQTLSGNGKLHFNDGAIVGIDLSSMVRNVQSAFGLAEDLSEKQRTDFSELLVQFSARNGVSTLETASLISPLLRIAASGSADLVQEKLNIRIDPKFVGTLKGQGDTQERSGVMVPVMVGGTFQKPKFKPDLKAILEQPLPDKEALKKAIPPKEELKQDLEKKAQDLLKGLTLPERKKN